MYENLEYQRQELINLINFDKILKDKYCAYIGYINANYFFHEAMYSLHKGDKKLALKQFGSAILKGKGFLFSKRSLGFARNFLFKS
jgi:hypothetical protein